MSTSTQLLFPILLALILVSMISAQYDTDDNDVVIMKRWRAPRRFPGKMNYGYAKPAELGRRSFMVQQPVLSFEGFPGKLRKTGNRFPINGF